MKVTRLGQPRPSVGLGWFLGGTGGPSGQVPTSGGSNSSGPDVSWGSNVATAWSNGSNQIIGPHINFASGSNMTFAVASNTLTIHGLAGGAGVTGITSNGSNSLINAVNLAAGIGIALGVSGQTITVTNTGVPGPGGSGGGVEQWLINIDMNAGSTGNTNWTTINVDGGEINAADIESSGAQNDEIYWHVGVSAGTWTFRLLHFKGPNRGIYHVRVDDVDVGTIDGYAAGATKNQFSEVTGIVISGGKRKVALKMATKNASSSAYYGTATTLLLIRTA